MTAEEQRRYDAALAFTCTKHNGQYRKGGEPYVIHPIAVANILRDWGCGLEYQLIGLFHDLLEDTDAAEEEILALGGERVLSTVKLLTKQKDYVMEEYVGSIKKDPTAALVKAADRLHNLRCAIDTSEDFKRRYIWETVDFYLDLPHGAEIKEGVLALRKSLDHRLEELPMTYKAVNDWKKE